MNAMIIPSGAASVAASNTVRRAAVFFSAIALCVLTSARAGVTNVTGGGPLYASLTQAVAVANSGDELRVSTGTYFGNMVIAGKHLIIRGGYAPDFGTRTFDPDMTVVSTSSVAPVIFIDQGARVLLESVRVTGGGIFWLWGGGVFIGDECHVTARYCRVDHNTSWVGGGAAVWSNAMLVLDGSTIDDNTALLEGGGVYAYVQARVACSDPFVCRNNWAPRGGGMTLNGASLITTGPCSFDNNIAVERGGALYLFAGARADIAPHTTFGWTTPNLATNGDGGCVYAESSSFTMRGHPATLTCINRSHAAHDGGALYLSNSVCTLANFVEIAGQGATGTPSFFGGGICAVDSVVTLSNNVRIHSFAAAAGGAIAAQRSTLLLRDRVMLGDTNFYLMNAASAGGGIYAYLCTTLLTDVHVVYNGAQHGFGGGLCLLGTSVCMIADSAIANNLSGGQGGGIGADWFSGSLVLDHVILTGNTASAHGGGLYWRGDGTLTAGNASQVIDNRAMTGCGGGVYLDSGGVHSLRTLEFVRNAGGASGGGLCVQSGVVNCTACVFEGNRAMTEPFGGGDVSYVGGGGAAIFPASTAMFINCVWRDNRIDNLYGCGGALYVRGSTVTLGSIFSNSVHGVWPPTQFIANRAGVSNSAGGAVFLYEGAAAACAHAFFASNHAINGGAILATQAGLALENSVFAGNMADNAGGGMLLSFMPGQPLVRHCTFADNSPAAVEVGAATAQFQNCIFWGNYAEQIAPWSYTAVVSYCDIEGGYPGIGNIDSNPLFVAAAALNYDLHADSPCRDAGMHLPTVTNDCIGTLRPYGTGWDMGAYEFVPEPGMGGMLVGVGFTIYNLQFTIVGRRRTP